MDRYQDRWNQFPHYRFTVVLIFFFSLYNPSTYFMYLGTYEIVACLYVSEMVHRRLPDCWFCAMHLLRVASWEKKTIITRSLFGFWPWLAENFAQQQVPTFWKRPTGIHTRFATWDTVQWIMVSRWFFLHINFYECSFMYILGIPTRVLLRHCIVFYSRLSLGQH